MNNMFSKLTDTWKTSSSKTSSLATGQYVEQWVKKQLQYKGLRCLTQNYRSKMGEIDLIMTDHETIVFIEVRYRKKTNYGDGGETVTYAKQQKIIRTAQLFLQRKKLGDRPCRFDVIKVKGPIENLAWCWIPSAFTVY